MNFLSFSPIDYILFVLMFGLSCAIGIYYGCFKKQQTTVDYLLGGRNMKIFPVSMSLVASTLAGITLLGIPAEIYVYGMQYSLMIISVIIMGLITNYVYLPVFYKLQLINAYDYIEIRFDKITKKIASGLYAIGTLVYLSVTIYASSLAFNQMTGFDFHLIAIIMTLICVFYTAIGGLKAVIWADTLQFCVTLFTLGFILVLGTKSVGGLSTIWERSRIGDRLEFFNMDLDPTIRNTFWSVVLGNIAPWITYVSIEPAAIQRFSAVPSLQHSQKCLLIYIAFTVVTKFVCSLYGLIIYAKYFDCDPLTANYIKKPDQIMPYYVLDVASSIPGLSGLFVAGLFSTGLSALSTALNALSGLAYKDFIEPYMSKRPTEERASLFMKIITVVLGIISVLLLYVIERLGTLVQLLLSLRGIVMGPILGIFTMGMLFPCVNRKGALFGAIGSLTFMTVIVVQNQIYVWNNAIRYKAKPLDVYGCNVTTTLRHVFMNRSITRETPSEDEPLWLFRISFNYYILLGTLLTMIIGLPVSLITRRKASTLVNADLLSPFVSRFINRSTETISCRSVERELQNVGKAVIRFDDKDGTRNKLLQ